MPDILAEKMIIVGPDGEEAEVVAGALQTTGGGGGGGGAVTVADGADVTQGAIADAAVAAGAAGTVSAKLRTVTTLLNGGLPAALGAAGGLKVDGTVASGSADSGEPVKIGGKYNSTLPTFTNGQRGDLQITSRGLLRIQVEQGTNVVGVANPTTGNGADIGLVTASRPSSYNGATWDAIKNDGVVGGQSVGGTVASGSADSGNPVKVGAKYNATLPTFADGQRGDLQIRGGGQLAVALFDADGNKLAAKIPGDTQTPGTNPLSATTWLQLNNGAGAWDQFRNNNNLTLLSSAARTATTSSADQTNFNGRGVVIITNVTVEGAATLTLTVQGKDSISSNYYDLITGIVVYTAASDTPPTTRAVVLYPGVLTADAIGIAGATGTTQKSVSLPRTWRATITPADATTTTYSVSAVTLL